MQEGQEGVKRGSRGDSGSVSRTRRTGRATCGGGGGPHSRFGGFRVISIDRPGISTSCQQSPSRRLR
eukprot:7490751-Pyramimonas_sp.AAC.1